MKGKKIKMVCNHCGDTCIWYKNFLYETNMIKVENNYYCLRCSRKILTIFLDENDCLDLEGE
jgi:hypothetical protein